MSKSEVKNDIDKMVDRIEALKNISCLSNKVEQLNMISSLLLEVSSDLSLGMQSSITGRKKPNERCRFCGK